MDTKDHILILHMLAQQNVFMKQLCDALKANALLTDDDLNLFGEYIHSDQALLKVMVQRTLKMYLAEARKMGCRDLG